MGTQAEREIRLHDNQKKNEYAGPGSDRKLGESRSGEKY